LEEVLDDANAVYDVEFDETRVTNGNLSYIHKVLDGSDVYFFANSSYTTVDTTVTLRGTLSAPAVWDPHTGERYQAHFEHTTAENGEPVTKIRLTMPAVKSLFIVDDAGASEKLYWGAFETALEKARAVDQSAAVASSIEALKAAIAEAEALLSAGNVTQKQIDGCERLLLDALAQVEYKNLAFQKPAQASSSLERAPQFSLAGLTDGKYETMYSSTSQDTVNHTEWVMIDLEKSYEIDRINLVPRSDSPYEGLFYPVDYTIEVSNDQKNWTAVYTETGVSQPATGAPVEHVFDAVTARYVRVSATNLRIHPGIDNYYRLQLSEVEVYRAEKAFEPTVTATDPESGAAVSEVVKDGWFRVTVVTADDVRNIRLVNEYGLNMGRKEYSMADNGDGTRTFTMLMNMGTVGQNRELTVMAQGTDGAYTDTGLRVCLDIVAPIPQLYLASIAETARVNEPVAITAVTDRTVTRIQIYNEYGLKMGPSASSFEDTEQGRVWTVFVKIGTPGKRHFAVTAINPYGKISETMQTGTVTVSRP
ncbi:MAG: hypothetical protein HFE85_04640, partial [Clostridiales bacterium]|nr:hypothetical protein [Clostridiales bacterium]